MGKETLNETDVRMMAKGYWAEHFEWLIHPKVKLPLLMACLCTGLLFLVLIVGTASVQGQTVTLADGTLMARTLPSAVTAVLGILALCIAGGALAACYTIGKERSEFLTESVEAWRTDEARLPSREQIKRFVNRR